MKNGAKRALDAMLSMPTSPAEDNPTSSAERIALLLNRVKDIRQAAAPNKYQRSFVDFLFDLVVTKDEAMGGMVRPLPKDPYIYEVADALITEPLLLMEKSRRVRASWISCSFVVWLAAGGQDPRWDVLMNSTGNRQIIIASRKLQDLQGSIWFLQNRVKFIVDKLEENNIRDRWPEFPYWKWTAAEVELSNGTKINAVAQGADQMRGAGGTLVYCEEGAFWTEAKASIESALPVIHGGGHLLIVTTPNAGSYCSDLVKGRLRNKGSLYG